MIGWGTWIRTRTTRSRAVRSTVKLFPKSLQDGHGLEFALLDRHTLNRAPLYKHWRGYRQDLSEALNQTFEKLQSNFTEGSDKANAFAEDGMARMMGFWQGPMETWQKFASQTPFSTDGLNINLGGMGGGNPMEQMLGMPGLGYTREDEERYKQLMAAGMDYQQAMLAYNQFFSDMGQVSVERMKDKVAKLQEAGKTIDSGRALYDLWVAACEDVYAERAITPEYSKLHGGLVNALMAFKNKWGEIMDNRLASMNMPTQREMRTLQNRLQETRREMRSLRSEVEQLKEQMLAAKSQSTVAAAPAEAPAAEAAPAAPRKKVAKKAAKKKVAKKAAAK